MAGIGAVTCSRVIVNVVAKQGAVTTWEVPGLDGHGVQVIGDRATEFSATCVFYDTSTNVNNWFTSLIALASQVVTFEDDWGGTHGPAVVKHVGGLNRKPAIHEAGVRGEVQIELQMI